MIVLPSIPRQVIVNVVAPESDTVEAPPDVLLPVKLPSELDSVHAVTYSDVQKIVVRPPIETDAGNAHIFTIGCCPDAVYAVVPDLAILPVTESDT